MAGAIDVRTLLDGGQTTAAVAAWVGGFIDAATASLDLALYDLALDPPEEGVVLGALAAAVRRGVAVRLAYNHGTRPTRVPPPPVAKPSDFEKAAVPARPVPGVPDLMHHKFMVRDRDTVWTGSTNWTEDSWRREE